MTFSTTLGISKIFRQLATLNRKIIKNFLFSIMCVRCVMKVAGTFKIYIKHLYSGHTDTNRSQNKNKIGQIYIHWANKIHY